MCGRITQARSKLAYAEAVGWDVAALPAVEAIPQPSWNVAPGTAPLLMHCFGNDMPHIEPVHWGYRPSWAAEKGVPPVINARIEKAGASPFFRGLWKAGRAIVPADGWYEWTGERGRKQPWYIRLKSRQPMFLAALASHRSDGSIGEHDGFAIVTAAADAGMVDIHDRRPVVLSADDARLWMDEGLDAEQAAQLARSMSLPPERFEWHEVSRAVNYVRNDGPQLIAPVAAE